MIEIRDWKLEVNSPKLEVRSSGSPKRAKEQSSGQRPEKTKTTKSGASTLVEME
jgi:hypothetical protein